MDRYHVYDNYHPVNHYSGYHQFPDIDEGFDRWNVSKDNFSARKKKVPVMPALVIDRWGDSIGCRKFDRWGEKQNTPPMNRRVSLHSKFTVCSACGQERTKVAHKRWNEKSGLDSLLRRVTSDTDRVTHATVYHRDQEVIISNNELCCPEQYNFIMRWGSTSGVSTIIDAGIDCWGRQTKMVGFNWHRKVIDKAPVMRQSTGLCLNLANDKSSKQIEYEQAYKISTRRTINRALFKEAQFEFSRRRK